MKPRYFFIALTAANLALVLYGLLALMTPGILLQSFSQHVYQFPADAVKAIAYLGALYRLLGFFNLILGMVNLLILRQYWVSGQKWIVQILIASTALAYIGPILFDNTVGSIGFFEIIEDGLFAIVVISSVIMFRQQG